MQINIFNFNTLPINNNFGILSNFSTFNPSLYSMQMFNSNNIFPCIDTFTSSINYSTDFSFQSKKANMMNQMLCGFDFKLPSVEEMFANFKMFNIQMPNFNKAFTTLESVSITKPKSYYSKKYGKLDLTGYNKKNGEKLASEVKAKAKGFGGACATYVKNAIKAAGLGEYQKGHAYQMTNILDNNPNFKKISTNVDVEQLPAGCILMYGQGVAGYSSKYGHTEITLGNGQAASDGITNNIRQHPTAIYMPC